MAGHNKWKQIKEKKARTDGAKSRIFARFSSLIQLEAKKSSGDRNAPGLRSAIERARKENMPNENIERAVKRASEVSGENPERIIYEAYGPGGTAMIIDTLTENRNKTAQEIKHALSKHGLSLASPGSALWAFDKDGTVWKPKSEISLSDDDLQSLEKLVEDMENNESVQEIFTNAE